MSNKQNLKILSLIIAILLPIFLGIIVASITGSSVSTWYPTLRRPTWNPPSWIFGPMWTVLYGLMGLASWLVWKKWANQERQVRSALLWYGLQLGLNLMWSIIFFGMRRPDLALIEIIVLWGAILITVIKFARIDRLAAWLLVPYQLWVTFAAALNAAIWWLNRSG